jgi:hypothetical protein
MDRPLDFVAFPKIGRLSRGMIITEKLDGTNAQVNIVAAASIDPAQVVTSALAVEHDGATYYLQAGSRTRLITPDADNFGFARWVHENAAELVKLGEGRHFGEWWGEGIQRRYGIKGKRFSLFNVNRWQSESSNRPTCCDVVPVLYRGEFDNAMIDVVMRDLAKHGSAASPGFMRPEGIIVFHTGTKAIFKKTFEHDEAGKGRDDLAA